MKYDLLKRGTYTMVGAPGKFHAVKTDKAVPLQLLEAENAVQIAQVANADQYAKDTYDSADNLLRQAEAYEARKAGAKPVIMTSREAVQNAETARLLALKRQEDERIAREKQAAADREAAAELRRTNRLVRRLWRMRRRRNRRGWRRSRHKERRRRGPRRKRREREKKWSA